MQNNIKAIPLKQIRDNEAYKGELDLLYSQIQQLMWDYGDQISQNESLSFALQEVQSQIESLDIKIDY